MATYEDSNIDTLLPHNGKSDKSDEKPLFLTPKEVAFHFGVDPKTVTRWANSGKLTGKIRIIRTPGNHRRFRTEDVFKLLEGHDA